MTWRKLTCYKDVTHMRIPSKLLLAALFFCAIRALPAQTQAATAPVTARAADVASVDAIIASGVDGIREMLWFQGEIEGGHASGMASAQVYYDALQAMHAGLQSETVLTFPLRVGQIGNKSKTDGTSFADADLANWNAVRVDVQERGWNEGTFLPGPVTADIDIFDPTNPPSTIHFTRDSEAVTRYGKVDARLQNKLAKLKASLSAQP